MSNALKLEDDIDNMSLTSSILCSPSKDVTDQFKGSMDSNGASSPIAPNAPSVKSSSESSSSKTKTVPEAFEVLFVVPRGSR